MTLATARTLKIHSFPFYAFAFSRFRISTLSHFYTFTFLHFHAFTETLQLANTPSTTAPEHVLYTPTGFHPPIP
ncbi:hypothetical protein [Bartonella machadoae]|uniref:hypothetical protein n=1 Tax=Bartonella machadoae TaxID=2893471 RepID=UPI001F4D23C4|nr:hypothetical protein [Bartonella machadoae]UNE53857.1 hypothetical protein LNM86_09675 [Bartonella machadoae]UNE53858.1 hypothetical protein LNM86_09680 [Bartonella machadoae]